MSSKIILVGKNGAGKGTRLSKLGREDDFHVLAMSGLLGNVKNTDPELWEKIDAIMKAGDLVPDDIIIGIILKEIEKIDKSIIFDGFPRTMAQAKAMLEAGIVPDAVVEVYVDDDAVIRRAKDRVICSCCKKPYTLNDFNPPKVEGICDDCGAPLVKRPDDEEAIVKKRLNQYQEQTFPIIDFFSLSGVDVYTVDNNDNAKENPQEVFNRIMSMY